MDPKLLESAEEYKAARVAAAALRDAAPGTPDSARLALWEHLIDKYEREHSPADPDPIEAIRACMEARGLRPADLVPYIGSRSKVSEVLSGRRPLSLAMIRRLHKSLGIPAEVLIGGEGTALPPEAAALNWEQFPLAEIVKREWLPCFRGTWRDLRDNAEEVLAPFLFPRGMDCRLSAFMQGRHFRGLLAPNEYALWAWLARVLNVAMTEPLEALEPAVVTEELIAEMAHLSRMDDGPRLAKSFLRDSGIHFVTEPHLTGAVLDAASLRCPEGHCLIALTLRHDRLDSFWESLCHELVHVMLHLQPGTHSAFVDDLDARADDPVEEEADACVEALLLPPPLWAAERPRLQTAYDIKRLAGRLRISPALIAGRLQREHRNRRLFDELTEPGMVRKQLSRPAPMTTEE